MKKSGKFYKSMCKVGCIGFGGGSALIPVIEQEVIREQKIDARKNYDKDVMIASITPGSLTVKLASSLGGRNFGIFGMLSGAFLMAAPGAVFTILCLSILTFAQERILSAVQKVSIGVSAFIVCLLLEYVMQMLKSCRKEGTERVQKASFLMLAVFVLTCGKNIYQLLGLEKTPVFAISTVYILLSAFFFVFSLQGEVKGKMLIPVFGLIFLFYLIHGKAGIISNPYAIWIIHGLMIILSVRGLWKEFHKDKKKKKYKKIPYKEVVAWLVFLIAALIAACLIEPQMLIFAGESMVSALFSFGGGSAYLTVADGFFVDGGWITAEQFYGQIVNVVNILPGSVLNKVLVAVAFYAGVNSGMGWQIVMAFVLVAFVISVAVSCAVFHLLYALYDRFEIMRVFKLIHRWIRPIVAGMLLNIILTMVNQCIHTAEALSVSAAGVVGYLLVFSVMNLKLMKKVKPYVLIVGDVVFVLVLLGVL